MFTGTTAIAGALAWLAAAEHAQAQVADACGAVAADGSVRCRADDNPYRRGITYETTMTPGGAVDLSVALDSDVAIEPGPSRPIRAAVDLTGHLNGSVALRATDGASVLTRGAGQAGIWAVTESGGIDIAAPSIVTRAEDSPGIGAYASAGGGIAITAPSVTTGGAYSHGIYAVTEGGGSITIDAVAVRARGAEAMGIYASAQDGGDVSIVSSGAIRTEGVLGSGILASSARGNLAIEVADVRTLGDFATAIEASGQSVRAEVSGAVVTRGDFSSGVSLNATDGEAHVVLDGTIRTSGTGSTGARVEGSAGATISGTGAIRTAGDGFANGAEAFSDFGDARIDLASVVVTGLYSVGATAGSLHGNASVRVGEARAFGDRVWAVQALTGTGDASVEIAGRARADGEGAVAILAGAGGRTSVQVQDAITTGLNGTAISATGSVVDITVNGTVASRGGATADVPGMAILAIADQYLEPGVAGDLHLVNNGRIVARGDHNGGLVAMAADEIVIEGAGAFVTHGASSTALAAYSFGDVSVDVGRVHTTGDASIGIELDSDTIIRASVGELRTEGVRSHGIDLSGGAALRASVSTGEIVTAGERASGIRIVRNNGGSLDLDIHAGSIATSGAVADGITLLSDNSGRAVIHADRLEVGGNDAAGIYAEAAGLDLDLTVGSARATGERVSGIYAQGANVALHTTGTIEADGDGGAGVAVFHAGEAALTIDGDIRTSGLGSIGLGVSGLSPDSVATVHMTGDIAVSGHLATGFSSGGYGSIVAHLNNISNTGAPFAGRAIFARHVGDVDVTVRDVTLSGLAADSTYLISEEGSASLTVTGAYRTEMSGGLFVAAWGAASASVNDMEIHGSNSYAINVAGGDAHVTIAGTINDYLTAAGSFGNGGSAVYAYGGGGPLAGRAAVENNGSVNSFAERHSGIMIQASGEASLTGTGSVHTRGSDADAVSLQATLGEVLVAQHEIVTEGDLSNGVVITGSDADVRVALDRVATQGLLARGVNIFALGTTRVDIGAIETQGALATGLTGSTYGDIAARLDEVSTLGTRATGAQLDTEGDIAVQAGRISTVGNGAAGMLVTAGGDVSIAAAEIDTRGSVAGGISATAGGDAMLRIGTVTTSGGGSDGLALSAAGSADIELASVATSGEAAEGFDVHALGTVRAVVGSASASGADARAIVIASEASVALTTLGEVRSAEDALVLSAAAGINLDNRGAISAEGAAIRASGGAATIANSGSIAGALLLGDAADLITNSGAMRLTAAQFGGGDDRLVNHGALVLAGDLDFGEGADTLANHGILLLASLAANAGLRSLALRPVTRSIAGLSGFANSGLIDLRNGVAGDALDVSGGFTGSGGSMVALDVRFDGTQAADHLTIAGAATGSTTIVLNALDAPTSLQPGVVIVRAGAGTPAAAFRLATPATAGFFTPGLAFDAATGSFRLATAPSTGAWRLLKIVEGARSAWLESSDMVAAQLARGRGDGLWFAAGGNVNRRQQIGRFDAFGFAQDVDLGYEQDYFSTQFGYGFDTGSFAVGATAGYANSALTFGGSADSVRYDALNGGLYAALRSGRFRLGALAKYDRYDIDVSMASIGEKAAPGGSAFGARIDAGLRLGSARFQAEPRVGISYQRVSIDSLALSAATRFDDWTGGRATAGLRIASERPIGAAALKLYAEGDYVKALGEGVRLAFTTGTTSVDARDANLPDHGAGKLGLEVSNARLSGFVEALVRYGEGYSGGGARAGLRFAF